jgi:hypothetical protein
VQLKLAQSPSAVQLPSAATNPASLQMPFVQLKLAQSTPAAQAPPAAVGPKQMP